MSAVFDGTVNRNLTATLTGTVPDVATGKLYSGWIRSTYTISGANDPSFLENSDGVDFEFTGYIAEDATPNLACEGTYDGFATIIFNLSPSALPSSPTGWVFWAFFFPANSNGASLTPRGWQNTTAEDGSAQTGTTDTGTIPNWRLGAGGSGFVGSLTNCAIWHVANVAAADAIVAALQSGGPRRANEITGTATPIKYWPLLSDVVAGIGSNNLTNNNTVAFDADEPVWIEPSTGVARLVGNSPIRSLVNGGLAS